MSEFDSGGKGSGGKKDKGSSFWDGLRSVGSGLLEGFTGTVQRKPSRRDPLEGERRSSAAQVHRSLKAWRDRDEADSLDAGEEHAPEPAKILRKVGPQISAAPVGGAIMRAAKEEGQQVDANIISALLNPKDVGHPKAVEWAKANKGITLNRHTYMKLLSTYSKDQLKSLDAKYGIKLLRDEDLDDIAAAAARVEKAFAGTGRAISAEDARVAATALTRKEKLTTADLQFYKRGKDLGLNIEFLGKGDAEKKAKAYVPQPVVVPPK